MINPDDRKSKGSHWVPLFIDRNTAVYFNSFGIEYIPQEILNKMRDKSQYIKNTIHYLLDEIKHNDLSSEQYKKTCKYLNYVELLLNLVSPITGCVSLSVLPSLVCVPVGITSSAIGIRIYAISAGIKRLKSIIRKKKKNDKIALSGKDKSNNIEVLIFEALIDSCFSNEEFVSVNKVLKKYNEIKEEIKSH